ncbi:hypothetical protein B296_00051040, partial [Ensete ventricosum]
HREDNWDLDHDMQRPGRYERQGTLPREKRGLEARDRDGSQPDPKRSKVPALASVIVEALKVDSLQKICSSLEPILRRVLHFRTRLSLPLFTGGKVEGEQGAAIHVVLLDANSGHVVSSGPEASAKLDVLVLEGDFNDEDDENWTEEDFESHVVKEREGKRPLLTGDVQVSLKDGVGSLGELTFTDNSSWIRSRKFRLGLKIASGYCEGIRIREAKTEAFVILGTGMSNKMWDILVEHAKTCVLSGKYYVYYSDEMRDVGAIFNNIYEFCGLIAGGQFYSAEGLNDSQKLSSSSHQSHFRRDDRAGLALAPSPCQPSMEFQPYEDWSCQRDDFLSEEEIRLRSHEMLENEDMQHLLRTLNVVGASTSLHEDGYGFPSYVPSSCPNFNDNDDERSRPGGRAVVGWLKIKAAMRWGIFVRKKAAERRAAQLVELED